ncbi:glucuronate isomerase [Bacillus suaedae]|uniref:Uronate isomerase n=1 Tax=Halalkalibacter suaedae TaxID=2822140 RepID=A0A940WYM4_9BACI|nr:glucuronate isomerase [Bacillus suaedae]MBP3951000.1 glucuronate isomerase [Bacillus suaedae]
MKPFLGEDFLLETRTSRTLYHEFAKNMPIIDYHCHLSAKEIAENRQFSSMAEMWLGEDHYKWRMLRTFGVPEAYITGNKSEKEKFMKWAELVPDLIGNPLYHWTHLELQRCFGIFDSLNKNSAEKIWEACNQELKKERLSARGIIKQFNVKMLCTTDDPVDSLIHHKQLKEDSSFEVDVLPTFRPDRAFNIEVDGFLDYIGELEQVSDTAIRTFTDFKKALEIRINYFHEVGCRLSDHGLDTGFYRNYSEEEVESIFQQARERNSLSTEEVIKFKTAVLVALGRLYARKGWAMQLHIGGLRGVNKRMVAQVGMNTGFDSIADFSYAADLGSFLNHLEVTNELPKTILYGLNPRDNYMLATMAGNFQSEIPGKIQHGTAWWFNDQRDGMEDQLKTLANVGLLSKFIGMLTDSRSLLSYTRHEYFRRILCNIIGKWVENGEYPNDLDHIGKIVKDICYYNIQEYLDVTYLEKERSQ